MVDSGDETIAQIRKNFQKYDIGRKLTKITKQDITKLALLRNPKAD